MTDPISIKISEKNRAPRLDKTKDYIIQMPDTPLKVPGGLVISGGRNVVLIGGAIEAPSIEDAPKSLERRAFYLNGQTGTIHIEGLHIAGKDLAEGFNLDQRFGAIVQLQNIRIEKAQGTREGHHADLVQTWAGPAELRIDRFTGETTYQGFFLLPNQHFKEGPQPKLFDFRHMNLKGDEQSAYLLWSPGETLMPVSLTEVWLEPSPKKANDRDRFLWPKPSTGDKSWEAAKIGAPPTGDFVPVGVAGVSYVSPGYVAPQ